MANEQSGNVDDVRAELNPVSSQVASMRPEHRTALRRLLREADDAVADAVPEDLRQALLAPAPQSQTMPNRPSDSASTATWVEYCAAYGADAAYISGETQHWDPATEEYLTSKKLTRAELAELATKLGG